jgi:hypothetical protein
MGKKFDGQNIILIVNLVLILFLSYCSIPSKDQTSQVNGTEYVEHHDADHEEGAVKEDRAKGVAAEDNTVLEEHGKEVPEASSVEEPTALEEASANEEKTVAEETVLAGSDSDMTDIIAMDNPIYESHKKGIVQFTHQKHVTDYGIECGDCHHDDGGEPLADLKKGDEVVGCAECHSDPGKAPKSKDRKLTDSERFEYHTEALHANCISCHKAYNKKTNTKDAPASCGKCHPKE